MATEVIVREVVEVQVPDVQIIEVVTEGPTGKPGTDGADGADGSDGQKGDQGSPGIGLPVGGRNGQMLVKNGADDYQVRWDNQAGTLVFKYATYQLAEEDLNTNGVIWLIGSNVVITDEADTYYGVWLATRELSGPGFDLVAAVSAGDLFPASSGAVNPALDQSITGNWSFNTPGSLSVDGEVVWHRGNTVAGQNTGLDADTVDGIQGTNIVQTSRVVGTGDGLQGGGNLGLNRTLSVDDTVLRTTGAQDVAGVKSFTDQALFSAGSRDVPSIGFELASHGIYSSAGKMTFTSGTEDLLQVDTTIRAFKPLDVPSVKLSNVNITQTGNEYLTMDNTYGSIAIGAFTSADQNTGVILTDREDLTVYGTNGQLMYVGEDELGIPSAASAVTVGAEGSIRYNTDTKAPQWHDGTQWQSVAGFDQTADATISGAWDFTGALTKNGITVATLDDVTPVDLAQYPQKDVVETITADWNWDSTGGIRLPQGSSSQRPGVIAGTLRYNNALGVFEGCNNAGMWVTLSTGDALKHLAGDGISVTEVGSDVTFAVDNTVIRTTGDQDINGVKNFTGTLQTGGNYVLDSSNLSGLVRKDVDETLTNRVTLSNPLNVLYGDGSNVTGLTDENYTTAEKALVASATQPGDGLSTLVNDGNYVVDSTYTHTDNNYGNGDMALVASAIQPNDNITALTNDAGFARLSGNEAVSGNWSFKLADFMELPHTAIRPATPTLGMMIYNTTNSAVEAYANGSWIDLGSGGSGGANIKFATIVAAEAYVNNTGDIAEFTNIVITNDTDPALSGQYLATSVLSGPAFSWTAAIASGDIIVVSASGFDPSDNYVFSGMNEFQNDIKMKNNEGIVGTSGGVKLPTGDVHNLIKMDNDDDILIGQPTDGNTVSPRIGFFTDDPTQFHLVTEINNPAKTFEIYNAGNKNIGTTAGTFGDGALLDTARNDIATNASSISAIEGREADYAKTNAANTFTTRQTFNSDVKSLGGLSAGPSNLFANAGEIWAFSSTNDNKIQLGTEAITGQYGSMHWDNTTKVLSLRNSGAGANPLLSAQADGNIGVANNLNVGGIISGDGSAITGLTEEDYTTVEKTKLGGIAEGATATSVLSDLTNVSDTAPQDGQYITWNASGATWEPTYPGTGLRPVDNITWTGTHQFDNAVTFNSKPLANLGIEMPTGSTAAFGSTGNLMEIYTDTVGNATTGIFKVGNAGTADKFVFRNNDATGGDKDVLEITRDEVVSRSTLSVTGNVNASGAVAATDIVATSNLTVATISSYPVTPPSAGTIAYHVTDGFVGYNGATWGPLGGSTGMQPGDDITFTGACSFTQPLDVSDGTAAAPAIRFAAEQGTGIYHAGVNKFGLTVSSTPATVWDDAGTMTNRGNVGSNGGQAPTVHEAEVNSLREEVSVLSRRVNVMMQEMDK